MILRKGPKREFQTSQEKQIRRESAFFWEERNTWFSDIWFDLTGTSQTLANDKARSRSAAFPFELPYRLINMFSTKTDIIVDPFLGTGTTMAAAMATGRNCLGFEINHGFHDQLLSIDAPIIATANNRINQRIRNHMDHVDRRLKENYQFKYVNKHYDFSVMTRQEVDLFFNPLESAKRIDDGTVNVTYTATQGNDFKGD